MASIKGVGSVGIVFLALLGLAAGCGSGSQSQLLGFGTIAVTSITGPVPGPVPTTMTITGGDFGQVVGTDCTVRFRATMGTPFLGGTSATVDVDGTITSPTTIDVTSPPAVICGAASITAFVTVILPSGLWGMSAAPIAVFDAPMLGSISGGGMFPAAIPTPYTVTGTGFGPVGATVKVTWSSAVAIFEHGTSMTTQTNATIDSATMISGLSPEAAVCGSASQAASLTKIEFPNGTCTPAGNMLAVTFLAPTATSVNNTSGFAPHTGLGQFAAAVPEPFTVTGTGFGPVGGTATITFTHPGGTTLFGGNPGVSDTAVVAGTIVDSTTINAAESPLAAVCGSAMEGVNVTVALPGGSCTLAPGVPVDLFAPTYASITNVDFPIIGGAFEAPIAETFQITGQDFGPVGGTAIVRWTSNSGLTIFGYDVLPFTGSTFVDVPATIVSRTTLQGTSPEALLCPTLPTPSLFEPIDLQVTLEGGSCTGPTMAATSLRSPSLSGVSVTGLSPAPLGGISPVAAPSTLPLGVTTPGEIVISGAAFGQDGDTVIVTFTDAAGGTPFNGSSTVSTTGHVVSRIEIRAPFPVINPRLTTDVTAHVTVTILRPTLYPTDTGPCGHILNAVTFTAPPTITSVANARAPFQQGAPAASVANTWLTCVPTDTTITGTGFDASITELFYASVVGPTKPIGAGILGTLPEPTATAPGAGTARSVTAPTTINGASPTDATLTSSTATTVRVVNPDGQWHELAGLTWSTVGVLPNTNVTQDANTNAEMNIAVNPFNPLNACVFSHDATGVFTEIRHSYTLDGGNTWVTQTIGTAAANIPDGLGAAYNFRFDPVCGFDGFGNYWVVYGAGDGSRDGMGGTPYLVMAARSSDGGQTFDFFTPLPWQQSGNGDGSDRWTMATGKDGAVPGRQCLYVAGMDLNGRPDVIVSGLSIAAGAGPNGEGGAPSFLLTPSGLGYEIVNDSGPIVGMTFPVGTLQNPAVSVGPNGEVYVSWGDYDLTAGTKAVPFSADILFDADLNGLNDPLPIKDFGSDVTASSGILFGGFLAPIPPMPSRGYSMIPMHRVIPTGTNAGRIVMTYTDANVGGDTDVVTIYSDVDGLYWSSPALVHSPDATFQFHPWLDADPITGRVYVTWYDPRNGPGNSVQRFSAASSNGATWGTALLLSQGVSTGDGGNDYLEYNGVAVIGGCVYACWADRSNFTGDAPDASMQAYVSVYMQDP